MFDGKPFVNCDHRFNNLGKLIFSLLVIAFIIANKTKYIIQVRAEFGGLGLELNRTPVSESVSDSDADSDTNSN